VSAEKVAEQLLAFVCSEHIEQPEADVRHVGTVAGATDVRFPIGHGWNHHTTPSTENTPGGFPAIFKESSIMLLFSRVVTPVGRPRQVMSWVSEITAYVNDHSSLDVTCWAANFGYPIGTIGWSATVESQADLQAAVSGLLADDGYFDLLDAAADMITTPGQDFLRELVYGTPSDPPELGSVASITTARANVDRMADAVGWAIEMAQRVEGIADRPVAVLTNRFGEMGGITWISGAPDIATVEAAASKMRTDSGYLDALTRTADLFIRGSGHLGQLTRIA
jgi:hypothetical protein